MWAGDPSLAGCRDSLQTRPRLPSPLILQIGLRPRGRSPSASQLPCTTSGAPMADRILSRQFHGAEGVEAWRVLPDGAYAFFRTDSLTASARFIEAISGLVRDGDEPDIDIRGDGVTVLIRAFKGRDFGLVQSDLDLARAISTTARGAGLIAEPTAIQSLSIIPGASDRGGIMPFWQRVLGYDQRPDSPDEDLIDPHGRLAP